MPACAAPGVDLVRGCHEAEPQRLIRRAALKIVFECGVVLIAITGIPGCKWACPHSADGIDNLRGCLFASLT